VLNVGSGIALPTGRLALWLLEGYGRGELVIESPRKHDAFVLDVGELTRRYGPPCTYDELRTSCLDLGRRPAGEAGSPGIRRSCAPYFRVIARPRSGRGDPD
jgi:hypothetical protein